MAIVPSREFDGQSHAVVARPLVPQKSGSILVARPEYLLELTILPPHSRAWTKGKLLSPTIHFLCESLNWHWFCRTSLLAAQCTSQFSPLKLHGQFFPVTEYYSEFLKEYRITTKPTPLMLISTHSYFSQHSNHSPLATFTANLVNVVPSSCSNWATFSLINCGLTHYLSYRDRVFVDNSRHAHH